MDKPGNIILEAVVGSTMYGLAHENSDEDVLGVFVAPTRDILSLVNVKESYVTTKPDSTYHEVGKYVKKALGCNPTLIEILWANGYRILTPQGKWLIDNREKFLSEPAVRSSYYHYVLSQAQKLNNQGHYGNGRAARYQKHSRHLWRLLMQGRELLETGKVTVGVTPEQRADLFAVGELPVNELVTKFIEDCDSFLKLKSVLPPEPDRNAINQLLLRIRKANW